MRIEIEFSISRHSSLTVGRGCGIDCRDESLLTSIAALGYNQNRFSGLVEVRDCIDSPRLLKCLMLIEQATGLRLSEKSDVPYGAEYEFGVGRRFIWEKSEINAAALLMLMPQVQIATYAGQHADSNYTVEVDRRNRFGKVLLGTLGICGPVPVCCDEVKNGLHGAEFPELQFQPVLGPKGPLERPLWLLWSSKVMPPLAHPLLNGLREPFTGDISTGCYAESGTEPLYKFSRKAVEAMGAFDIAVTPQQLGPAKAVAARGWIVSQRFRKALTDLGIKKVEYTPVIYAED